MTPQVFDDRSLLLGEGPFWHPERQDFFWFDILTGRLLASGGREWRFDGAVTAAGWIDGDKLMVAHERALLLFDLETGQSEEIAPLEADNPLTRSNDGRADPWGGFWIGTMAKAEDAPVGAFYRYYRGEVRELYSGVAIPNATCFAPDGSRAYFCDTRDGRIMQVRLDEKDGWPLGEPEVFCNPGGDGLHPDGAVLDAAGNLWNAQYGGSRISVYAPDGGLVDRLDLPARDTTCPAFGGPKLDRLFCTSASKSFSESDREARPEQGRTYVFDGLGPGQAEHRVIL